MKTRDLSRREVLLRAALGVASLNVAAALTAYTRNAQGDDGSEGGDVDHLNAVLAAEYEAIATYAAGAPLLAQDSTMTKAARDALAAISAQFQAHHTDHAAALKKLIQTKGGMAHADNGKPNLPASFPATAKGLDVLKLAADREKHAALAYAQALMKVSDATAAKLLASIGGVESQHFALLYAFSEGLIAVNDATLANAALLSPAAFVLDPGTAGTPSLETKTALDALLALDPP